MTSASKWFRPSSSRSLICKNPVHQAKLPPPRTMRTKRSLQPRTRRPPNLTASNISSRKQINASRPSSRASLLPSSRNPFPKFFPAWRINKRVKEAGQHNCQTDGGGVLLTPAPLGSPPNFVPVLFEHLGKIRKIDRDPFPEF